MFCIDKGPYGKSFEFWVSSFKLDLADLIDTIHQRFTQLRGARLVKYGTDGGGKGIPVRAQISQKRKEEGRYGRNISTRT